MPDFILNLLLRALFLLPLVTLVVAGLFGMFEATFPGHPKKEEAENA